MTSGRVRFLLLALFLVIGGTACGRRKLRADELERNRLFAEVLLRQDRRDPGDDGFFQRNLENPRYPPVSRWCAISLGRIGDPRTLPLLYRALRAQDSVLRAAAAFAIGEIEDRDSAQIEGRKSDPRSRSELSGSLGDPSVTVRMRAIEALGKIGASEDAARIIQCLRGAERDTTPEGNGLIFHAITALMRIGEPSALPALRQHAADRDPEVQWRCANALVRLRDKSAHPQFLQLLASRNPDVRAYGIRGLGVCASEADVQLLEPFLPPRQPNKAAWTPIAIRATAVQALGAIRARASVGPLAAALRAEPVDLAYPDQVNFAVQAAHALGEIGGPEAESVLRTLLHGPGPVAQMALTALAKVMKGDPAGFVAAVRELPLKGPGVIRGKADGLGMVGGSEAIGELKAMLVRVLEAGPEAESYLALPAILDALGQAQADGLKEILRPFLESSDGVLLRSALGAYRPDPRLPRPWTAAAEAYRRIAGGADVEAKSAVIEWLEPWLREGEVLDLLRIALKDRDRNIRVTAARLLRSAGVEDVPASPGPAASRLTGISASLLAVRRKDRTFAVIETARGSIEIDLFREDAPVTTDNFIMLAKRGFYDGLTFMRVAPFYVIQGGDPRNDMEGGPGYTIRCEINMRPFVRGSVGMAIAGRDTGGSQFFITLSPQPHLDGGYTCFGQVVSGMQSAERIVPGDVIKRIRIVDDITWLDYRQY